MAKTPDQCFIDFGYTKAEQMELFNIEDMTDPDLLKKVDSRIKLAQQQKERAQRNALAIQKLNSIIGDYIEKNPKRSLSDAVQSLLVKDVRGVGGRVSIEDVADGYTGFFHRQMYDMLESYRSKKLGFSQDRAGPRNMAREIFGEATGDADAKAFAKAFVLVMRQSDEMFVKRGAVIDTDAPFAIPVRHNSQAVLAEGEKKWVALAKSKIDPKKHTDRMSGDPLTAKQLDDTLTAMYFHIVSDGTATIPDGIDKHLVRSMNLHFRNSKDFLDYADGYGNGEIFDQFTTGFESRAHDLAAMDVLGPNPDHSMNHLVNNVIRREGGTKGQFVQNTYNNLMGKTYGVGKWADFGSGTRSLQAAVDLGSATLSAMTDVSFSYSTAKFNDMSSTKLMGRILGTLSHRRKEDREFAAYIGLGAEHALQSMSAANRYSEIRGYNWATRFSDIAMRASGLNAWTDGLRRAFEFEFLANMSRATFKHDWNGLGKSRLSGVRRALQTYGITEQDWAKLRSAPRIKDPSGADVIDIASLEDQDLAIRFIGMTKSERNFAVPTPGARERAILNQGLKAGTVMGEFARGVSQYKAFPVTVMTTHLMRGMTTEGKMNKAKYMANLLVGTTAIGALVVQAKEISKGRKPRDIETDEFWAQALLQGGMGGIVGDMLFTDHTNYQNNLTSFLTGPSGDRVIAGTKFMLSGLQEFTGIFGDGGQTRVGADGLRMVERNIPGNRLWFARLALERLIFDKINREADPQWHARQRRMMRRNRDVGLNQHWWKPGKSAPTF